MSKMDDLRAMREARYEQARARAAGSSPAAAARTAKSEPRAVRTAAPRSAEPVVAAESPESPESAEALCGHRNMGGRTCTREAGHAAKSHRYS